MNVCLNGAFFPANTPLIVVQNRCYKWGDGVFETLRVFRGQVLLEELHFERLFSSLLLLEIGKDETFTRDTLTTHMLQLASLNNCLHHARIRLAVYRAEEGKAGYSIEAVPLTEDPTQWQKEGLTITLYPFARKSMDAFANLKSANYLPYVLAQRYAAEKRCDDAIVLNAQNYLCDASKANIFLVKGRNIFTPALHQGCVNGVMRRVVIEEAKKLGYRVLPDVVEEEQMLAAEEVFLTNAIQGIRWVEAYKHTTYGCSKTRHLFEMGKATIFKGLC
jgi:branched-chain amino acid aminotransferase